MSAGQWAAVVAAGAFVVLVVILAIPLIKLGRTLDEATIAIRKAHLNSDPLFNGANTTLTHVNIRDDNLFLPAPVQSALAAGVRANLDLVLVVIWMLTLTLMIVTRYGEQILL